MITDSKQSSRHASPEQHTHLLLEDDRAANSGISAAQDADSLDEGHGVLCCAGWRKDENGHVPPKRLFHWCVLVCGVKREGKLTPTRNRAELGMDEDLYDEFGNYIGPDVDDDDDNVMDQEPQHDDDAEYPSAHSPMVRAGIHCACCCALSHILGY
jgi:hypothetical protein